MGDAVAVVKKGRKGYDQHESVDRGAELDEAERMEKVPTRPGPDKVSTVLASAFYITNWMFDFLHPEQGDDMRPRTTVDRWYPEIQAAVDLNNTDAADVARKTRLFREHGIRYGNLTIGQTWESFVDDMRAAIP